MDPNTGKIKFFETTDEAEAEGYTIKLNDEQAQEMLKLSELARIQLIKQKNELNLTRKISKLNKQKLKAERKNERNRRKQNRH